MSAHPDSPGPAPAAQRQLDLPAGLRPAPDLWRSRPRRVVSTHDAVPLHGSNCAFRPGTGAPPWGALRQGRHLLIRAFVLAGATVTSPRQGGGDEGRSAAPRRVSQGRAEVSFSSAGSTEERIPGGGGKMETIVTTQVKPHHGIRSLLVALTRLAFVGLAFVAGPSPALAADRPPGLDDLLVLALREAGFTGTVGTSIEQRLGRPHRSRISPISAGCSCSTSHRRAARRQHLRRAATRPPTASATRSRSPSASRTTTSSGPTAAGPRNQRRTPDGDQHRVLPEADVERAVLSSVAATRSTTRQGFLFPPPEGTTAFPPDDPDRHAPADRAGAHPADRAGRGGRLHRDGGHDRPDSTSSTTAWARPCRRRTRAASATSRSARPCSSGSTPRPHYRELLRRRSSRRWRRGADRLHDVRPGDRRVRVHARRSPTRRSTASRAATGTR